MNASHITCVYLLWHSYWWLNMDINLHSSHFLTLLCYHLMWITIYPIALLWNHKTCKHNLSCLGIKCISRLPDWNFCLFAPINKKKYSIEIGPTIRYSNQIFRKNEYYSFLKIRPNTESSILFGDQLFERTNSSNYSF